MSRKYVKRSDLDMSAIEEQLTTHYVPEDAVHVSEVLADSLLDGAEMLMELEDWDEEATYKAVECWIAQVKKYGLENDPELLDMVDDAFLYLQIEAGCRNMEGVDPSQYL